MDADEIREAIRDVARHPHNVAFADIDRIFQNLRPFYTHSKKTKRKHSWLFEIGDQTFSVSDHNKGRRQVKACYVDNFIDAMINLGLYED